MNPEPSEQEKKIKQEMLLQYEAATMKNQKSLYCGDGNFGFSFGGVRIIDF